MLLSLLACIASLNSATAPARTAERPESIRTFAEAPAAALQTVTYVKCIWSAGSVQLVFKDAKGAELKVGAMTKAQRTGMAPDEPYVKFPEDLLKGAETNPKMVGKKFTLKKDAAGEVIEIKALK